MDAFLRTFFLGLTIVQVKELAKGRNNPGLPNGAAADE
jgi:hypothetical protein